MEQTVYADLLFFVNFCMDFQCLFLVARILRRPFSPWRAACSSALGALYACAALFLPVGGALSLLFDLAVCLLMCLLVFSDGRGKRQVFIPFALYFGVSAAMGGLMSAMAELLSRLRLPSIESGSQVSSSAFLLLAAAGGLVTLAFARLCQRRARHTRATLTLTMEGKTLTVTAIVDTANLLRDPVSGRPVVILARDAASKWLPALFPRTPRPPAALLAALPTALARHARLLPTSTVTGEGLMLALIPDAALLDVGRGAHPVELLVSAAPLEGISSEYEALLPVSLITE